MISIENFKNNLGVRHLHKGRYYRLLGSSGSSYIFKFGEINNDTVMPIGEYIVIGNCSSVIRKIFDGRTGISPKHYIVSLRKANRDEIYNLRFGNV